MPGGATGVVMVGTRLIIPSGVTLDVGHGVILRRKVGLTGNLIQNQAVAGTGRDANIGLVLGIGTMIDGGDVGAPPAGAGNQHHLRFRRCDGLTIRGAGATSTIRTNSGKYALSLGDVTDYTVEDIKFAASSDGTHIQGPAVRGRIANIFGSSADDLVAVTPRDWAAYDDVRGMSPIWS